MSFFIQCDRDTYECILELYQRGRINFQVQEWCPFSNTYYLICWGRPWDLMELFAEYGFMGVR